MFGCRPCGSNAGRLPRSYQAGSIPRALLLCLLLPFAPVVRQSHAASDPGPPPVEVGSFQKSPSWQETIAYLRKVDAASPRIRFDSFGTTIEGRPLPVVFVEDAGVGTPQWGRDLPRPTILIIGGIHSGEICGNDAIQLLLREIACGQQPEILDHLRLILVPIFNVDGHVRNNPYNRFTQNGPASGFGTRRNALRLDLNRDFAKLESPECQALIRMGTEYQPHIFVDLHTNDGFEHQYEILFSIGVDPTLPGSRGTLVNDGLIPHIVSSINADGFNTHPIGYPLDELDLTKGMVTEGLAARFTTGAFESRHTISILSEAHAYISFERRVKATLSLLHAILDYAVCHRREIVEAVESARAAAIQWAREPGVHEIGLGCRADLNAPREIEWLGKAFDVVTSPITGRSYARYRQEAKLYRLPFYGELIPARTATMPRGYLILPAWLHVVETLRNQGIRVEVLGQPFHAQVEVCRIKSVAFSERPYQGHHVITEIEFDMSERSRSFPPGTFWVPLDQPCGITAMHLLEAESPDALLRWNAFDTIFERGIILENWALEENARRLMADPAIRTEYEAALGDSAFAGDPDARLEFFYQKTPYVQEDENLYPVFRVLGEAPSAR